MGATRKLALVVVVGLIAISTAITVYTANEPNRRDDITGNQGGLSIERASSLYVTYCLQCHGPAGLGSAEQDADGNNMGRTGAPLNQSIYSEDQLESARVVYQSDDPVQQGIAEDWIRFRIMYGVPAEPQVYQDTTTEVRMPAFQHDLNVEQVNDLVWLIMEGDWNYVYNYAVHETGLDVCEATPTAAGCEDPDSAAAYPTVPASPVTESEDAEVPAEGEEEEGDADNGESGDTGAGGEHQVVATDNAFDTDAITAQPGDTIVLTNEGFAQHDFVVDELGLDSGLSNNGETVTVTIPEDAEAGDYEFYCSVPGHKEAGMVGTLTIEAP